MRGGIFLFTKSVIKAKRIWKNKNKPLIWGILWTLFISFVFSFGILWSIGNNYQKYGVEGFATQIMSVPEFKITKDEGLILNGEPYENSINGIGIVVDDTRDMADIVISYADTDLSKVSIISKNGIAIIEENKLILFDEYVNSELFNDSSVSDVDLKTLVATAQIMSDLYREIYPIVGIAMTLFITAFIYVCYGLTTYFVFLIGKNKTKFKYVINIVSNISIFPVLTLLFYLITPGISNVFMVLMQVCIFVYIMQISNYFKERLVDEDGSSKKESN